MTSAEYATYNKIWIMSINAVTNNVFQMQYLFGNLIKMFKKNNQGFQWKRGYATISDYRNIYEFYDKRIVQIIPSYTCDLECR